MMNSAVKTLLGLSAIFSAVQCLPHQPKWHWKPHTPALPLNEIDDSGNVLPDPNSLGYKLKYIGLGLGTQNYSCADGASAPTAVGALARLFDATPYLSRHQGAVDSLPVDYLKAFEEIYGSDRCAQCAERRHESEFPCQDAVDQHLDRLPKLGEHFFTAAGVPTFDLKYARPALLLASTKVGQVPAPADAYAGADDEGAVAWLYLTDNGTGVSKGLKAVYRVETAGGSPPATCDGQPDNIYVPYAAEYWFYD